MSIARSTWTLAIVFAAGCAGKYPMESSRRPLLLPDGEHQFVLELGKYRELRPYNRQPDPDWRFNFGYRYGVSDRVNFVLPFLWTHGWTWENGLELEAIGGLSGLGYGTAPRHSPSTDPREPNARARGLFYSPALAARVRFELDETMCLLARARTDLSMFVVRTRGASFELGGALVMDFTSYWSVGLGLAAGVNGDWDEGDTDPWVRLGRGPGAFGETPLLALHLVPSLDLTASPFLSYELSEDVLNVGVDFGVDWYFD